MLGNILKLIRIANEYISVKEVGATVGVSPTYISDIEHGNKKPTLEMLKKLSNAYNIPVSKIFLFEEIQKQQNLDYKQMLIMVLQYYIEKQDIETKSINDEKTRK